MTRSTHHIVLGGAIVLACAASFGAGLIAQESLGTLYVFLCPIQSSGSSNHHKAKQLSVLKGISFFRLEAYSLCITHSQ